MTRKGARQQSWSIDEITQLKDMAGRLSRREICRSLHRSRKSVQCMSDRLGISLRCYKSRLVWCVECASWRSRINPKTGRCRVCQMRAQLQGREEACADVWAQINESQKAAYTNTESLRHTRTTSLEPRPKKRASCPVSRYERAKAEEQYLLDLEEWEYRRALLPYNAAKKRLQRMREHLGQNPRKNLQKSEDMHYIP